MKANYDAEPFMVEQRVPVGPSRVETHVIVPAMQTLITMILVVGIVLLWRWEPVAGVIGALGLLVWAWRILLGDRLLWKLETVTRRDITGDGAIGAPTITLFNQPAARSAAARAALPTRDAERVKASLTEFAYLCASVDRPTEQALGIPTGDRAGYVAYRDALISLGIAAWNDPARRAAGWHLAVEPADAARIIAAHVV